MNGWEGIEWEMYGEQVMEVCEKCLKIRITLYKWVKPTEELYNIFLMAKKYRIRTLCHKCLKDIFALQEKLIFKLCKCGTAFHNKEKVWYQLSKMQLDNLNSFLKEGKVEVVREICPECKKMGGAK